jgi:DNA repair exonuclease SbcCD ATPase subunit
MDIVTEKKEETKVYSGFGKRNANKERIAQEEEELRQLKEPATGEESDAEPESAEERTFKKRYGDLRRHSQQQQNLLQKQIDELKQQLQASTEKQIKLPKSEDELAAWAKEYPDVAKIIETIAIKKASEQAAVFEERMRSLDEREAKTAQEKAEAELLRLHPDFDEIRDSDDFHDWVEEQPSWVQKALYENDTDAKSAARAIDLYKTDKGLNKPKSKAKDNNDDKEAARSVNVRGSKAAPSGDEAGLIYESDVNKMTTQQYEANHEAITKAIKTGKFVYDLSGSAR